MRIKSQVIRITATAIYTQMQGLLALTREADYIALYYNRMENMDIDTNQSIKTLRQIIENHGFPLEILTAGFKISARPQRQALIV